MKIYNNKKNAILLFLFLSLLTVVSCFFDLAVANWIDIPTHFAGGIVVAAFLPKEIFKKKPLFSIFVIAAIGFGWEFIEIATAKKEIFTTLFQETRTDKAGDLIVGLTGFIFAYDKTDRNNKNKKQEKRTNNN